MFRTWDLLPIKDIVLHIVQYVHVFIIAADTTWSGESHQGRMVRDVVVHIECIHIECSINSCISLLAIRINHNFVITIIGQISNYFPFPASEKRSAWQFLVSYSFFETF